MLFLSIVLVVILIALFMRDKQNQLENNSEKMLGKAEWFWNNGDYDKATWQINVYLQTKLSVTESTQAYLMLENYYNELGKFSDAATCRMKIAELNGKIAISDEKMVVSAANVVDLLEKGKKSGDITIQADYYDTDNMVLQITSSNMMPDKRFEGLIVGQEEKLNENAEAQTTEWFTICSDQKYLTISGGFNTSIWQFKGKDGNIIDSETMDKQYNDLNLQYTGNTIWSTVPIPEAAIEARVTFWNGEQTSVYNNPVCINYGTYPNYSVHECKEYEIPDLKVGERLEYNAETSTWTKITKNEEKAENLPEIVVRQGNTISLKGSSIGSVEIKKVTEDNYMEGGYGVRWSTQNTYPIGERVGKSFNMNFGYEMGEQWIGTSDGNDFDQVYPWSDIRLCKVLEDGTVVYSEDVAYEEENADIMVEIPCFYVRRMVDSDYEYIWISESEEDEYQLDPAFIKDGEKLDKIYVGAYLSGYNENNKIGSYDDTQPLINVSLNTVKQNLTEKGNNWSELDLKTLSMLQKLFLVETACKDSQALFMGVVNLSWGTCYAVKDSDEAVNTIELEDNASSQKINIGDTVTVFDVPQGENYYNILTQYENNNGWDRTITGRTKLENGNIQLEFSGEPVKILENSTMIMNLPHRNGKTNSLSCPTGQTSMSQSGTTAFRYRYIENFWGSVCVMLDGVTVNNGIVNIEDGDTSITLGYELTGQNGTPSEGVSPADASICVMGYDEENSLYMLPIEVGNGASSVTGYCDAFFYQKDDRDLIITYGLTWDLRQYAGLFGYRANISADDLKVESGSRILYR